MKKMIISSILMLLSLDMYTQIIQNPELIIENCIKKEYKSVGLDIEAEFNIFIDTLISQGILRNNKAESLYGLYNMIRYVGVLNYRNTYRIDKFESNAKLFYECFFQFKADTSDLFKKTKLFEFYNVLNLLENYPSIITFVNEIKCVLEPKDLKKDIYKYYTLYMFYFLFTTEKEMPQLDIDIPEKRIIKIQFDHKQKIYINNKKVNKNKIEELIDNITNINKESYWIKLNRLSASVK